MQPTTKEMTMELTPNTTLKELYALGITQSQIQSLINATQRKSKRLNSSNNRASFMEEVFALMLQQPNVEWKNGKILKNWYPNGKSSDEEIEKARRKMHSEISRALQDLTKAGRIVKKNNTNTSSGTFYTITPSLPAIIK
jgi:predicted transcriptional regulator